MKKYFVFILSFVLLYVVAQILSGFFLTALYTPELSSMNNSFSQEVTFGNTSFIPLLITLLIATLSYSLSQLFFKTIKK
ncbi:hypothetical protein [Bacillus sp. AK128]